MLEVSKEKKVIYVETTKGGKPPSFGGDSMSIHDMVRHEMYKIYTEGDYRITIGDQKVDFTDDVAKGLFDEGKRFFLDTNLASEAIIQDGQNVCILTWRGDKVVNTIVAILLQNEFKAGAYSGVVELQKTTVKEVTSFLKNIASRDLPTAMELAEAVPEKGLEKYDDFLPEDLLSENYGERAFDVKGASDWLQHTLNL